MTRRLAQPYSLRMLARSSVTGLLATAVLALGPALPVQAGETIVRVDTRPAVTVRVLLLTPPGASAGMLLMFPGGDGKNHFGQREGQIRLGGNFLVRTAPLFVEQGLAVAVVDTPSDQAGGMSDQFRTGAEHAADVGKIIEYLAAKHPGPIFLVGTSRGTLSAAHIAAAVQNPRLAGLALTSSLGEPHPRVMAVSQLPIEKIRLPVLLVHHGDDRCWATPFGRAQQLRGYFKGSPKVDFVEVRGGDPPRSDPCEPLSAHGFLGKEGEVVGAIAAWAQGRPVPPIIGP